MYLQGSGGVRVARRRRAEEEGALDVLLDGPDAVWLALPKKRLRGLRGPEDVNPAPAVKGRRLHDPHCA